jgi:myo-inositol-1(or 4)-monophosphatase
MSTFSPNLNVMIRAVEKAGRSLVRDFNEVEKLQISVKGPGDFVTAADKRSEEIIVENLQKDRPEWGFLGEEGTNITGSDKSTRWIIDPLDGTNNFLHGIPHWCITVALERHGEVIAAVTYDPIRQETFRAEKGQGAFMDRTRLRVSGRKNFDSSQIGLDIGGSKTNEAALKQQGEIWTKVSMTGAGVRFYGAMALDMAYVAAGRLDAVVNWRSNPWDVAAGLLLVREAKGIVTDFALKPATPDSGTFLLGNPDMHRQMADILGLK